MLAKDWIEKIEIEYKCTPYKVSQMLDVPTAVVSQYKTGKVKTVSESMAIKIAKLLKIEEKEVVFDQMAEKAKDEESKEFWVKLASSAAALFPVMVAGIAHAQSNFQCILC